MPSISMKVKLPSKAFGDIRVRQEIQDALDRQTTPDLKRLFKQTTNGWDHEPTFTAEPIDTPKELGVFVGPSGGNADKYRLVVLGSPKHTIRARRGQLRFQSGYVSATKAGSLISNAKKRFGTVVKTPLVNHPGFEGREFDKLIAKEYLPTFEKDMQAAVDRAAKGI